MAGTKGNQNAKGSKGGGRKSAYQELADARKLHDMFFKEQDQELIERKIGRGKFALKDRFLLNGMEGDSRILTKLIDKLYPDGIDVKSGGQPLSILFDPTFNATPRKTKGDSK